MANVLGVSALYHDAAAALLVDGKIACAISEERLSRVKNDPSLPLRAISACLRQAGLRADDLDRVVFYEDPFKKLERVLVSLLRSFPRSATRLPGALSSQWGSKLWVLDRLAEFLRLPRSRVVAGSHHQSHAASAFFCSPYESAAVLTVDGVGELATTAIWHGRETKVQLVEELHFPHSLGLLYSALTAYLGFEVNEGEFKVMGLSALGRPRFRDEFAQLLRTASDGSYELGLEYFDPYGTNDVGYSRRLVELLGPSRPYGSPLRFDAQGSPEDEETARFADIAASAQSALEEALLGLARRARRLTGEDHLCLAGGVALNAVANARLLRAGACARLFVQPAAGDAGGALGAAIVGAIDLGDPRPAPLSTGQLGLSASGARAQELARGLGLVARVVPYPSEEAAGRIARGQIVGWVQGPSEWGPRALGGRSLLARADDIAQRERLNRLVKHREPFRPFAPAVLAEETTTWFEGEPNDMTPFMTTVCPVRRPNELAAITHHDGTARLQTVGAGGTLRPVLSGLAKRGLPPVVLNTSLNENGQPIVTTEGDALSFFVQNSIDALLVEDVVIERPDAEGR